MEMSNDKTITLIKERDKEDVTTILSSFETRANRDIQLLMRVAFESGQANKAMTYDNWITSVKRELLDL